MKRPTSPGIEPLESRIAPAVTILHPIFDIKAGIGQTGADIDLAKMVDAAASYRTIVEFQTNINASGGAGSGIIRLELFDDKTPLTVQNFLSYVNNTIADNANNLNDYDGTYFHRLVGGFVLQGGGFNGPIAAGNRGTHVGTPFQVHNEFNNADPELDPVTGTLAMAKVGTTDGGGPHSATSEFFISYADNSATLDDQNGGFTVFGKVTQGMDIVNAMATLRRFAINNLNGTVNTPQNPNADGTPTTAGAGASPTADQLIKIVDARVVTPTAGIQGNHIFSEVSVEKISGDDFLTQTFNPANNKLTLDYAPGKAGVAKVKVKVTDTKGDLNAANDEFVFEEFNVTVLPNLVASVTNSLGNLVIPGQKGIVNVNLINNGAGIAKGDIKVRLFMSEINASGVTDANIASGFTLEQGTDVEITADGTKPISLLSGKSLSVSTKYEISPTAAGLLQHNKNYRLLALVESTSGTAIQELFTDDNVGNVFSGSTFQNAFGTVGDGRKGVTITVPDDISGPSNDVTLILKGPGKGEILRNLDGSLNITLSGTTTASSFSVKAAKGITPRIGELHVNDVIGKVALKNAQLLSHFSASGGAKSLIFGDIGAIAPDQTSNFSIGGFANLKTTISLGTVRDYAIDASSPIKSLTAKAWLNLNAQEHETLDLSGIGKLTIEQNLEANVNDESASAIASITVKGAILNSTLSTDSAVKKLTIGNATGATFNLGDSAQIAALATSKGTLTFKNVSDSSINASYPISKLTSLSWTDTAASQKEELKFQGLGDMKITGDLEANITELGLGVKSITVSGAVRNSVIKSAGDITSIKAATLDGVSVFAGVSAKPTLLADLANARKIGSITASTAFLNTTVVGSEIGKIAVSGVTGAGSAKFGFYADVIKSYVRAGGPKLTNLTTAGESDPVAPNYQVLVF